MSPSKPYLYYITENKKRHLATYPLHSEFIAPYNFRYTNTIGHRLSLR